MGSVTKHRIRWGIEQKGRSTPVYQQLPSLKPQLRQKLASSPDSSPVPERANRRIRWSTRYATRRENAPTHSRISISLGELHTRVVYSYQKKKKNPVTETESITELSRIVVDRGARGRKKSERRREKKCEEKRMIKKKRQREKERETTDNRNDKREREREKSLKPRDRLRNQPISETEQRDFRGRVYNFPVVQRPYQNEPEYPNHPGGKPCWRAKVSASLVTFPGARPSFSRFIDR